MKKDIFIAAIKAIQAQYKYDNNIANHLEQAFPNAFRATLLPDNTILQQGLIEVLKDAMNDEGNWIEYFIFELDFGRKNDILKVTFNDVEQPLHTPTDLYNLLKKEQK
jgi:hypothetical protein